MGETKLSGGIQKALKAKGCRVIRIQSGILPVKKGGGPIYFAHCAPTGTPDLLVIRGRLYTWLEVKDEGKDLSREQQAWHEWAVSNGLRIALVRSISEAIRAVFL